MTRLTPVIRNLLQQIRQASTWAQFNGLEDRLRLNGYEESLAASGVDGALRVRLPEDVLDALEAGPDPEPPPVADPIAEALATARANRRYWG